MASITEESVVQTARAFGFAVPEADVGDYRDLLERTRTTFDTVMNMEGWQSFSMVHNGS